MLTRSMLVVALLGLSGCQMPASRNEQALPLVPPSPPPGRYQLFQGNYQFMNLRGEQFRAQALLKIDTATGVVWIGEQMQVTEKDGRSFQRRFWRLFEEEMELPKEVVKRMQ
jgi:hypothetical protein